MVSLAKKNENKPFHMIAGHCQNADKETIVKFVKSQKLEADSPNFTISSFASHPDVKSQGIPFVGIFDHTGKLIFTGRPSDMDAVINTALKKVPNLYIGEMNYTSQKVKTFGNAVEQRKDIGKTMGKLEKLINESEDETERNEASDLVERLKTRFGSEKEKLETLLESDPIGALAKLKALSKELKGSTFGSEINTFYSEKKSDPQVKASIPVGKKLTSLRNEYNKLLKNGKVPSKKLSQVKTIIKKLNKLADSNSELPIAEKVREFISEIE